MYRVRRILALALLVVSSAAVLVGGSPALATPPAPQALQLTSEMLSGLSLRNIGPALMSGRFVDIEGV